MFEDLDVLVSVATALVPKTPLFFLGPTNLGALGSNTASLLGAQEYRFSFGCPKRETVFDPRAPKLLRPEKKSGNACIEHAFAQIYCKKSYVSCYVRPMEKSGPDT